MQMLAAVLYLKYLALTVVLHTAVCVSPISNDFVSATKGVPEHGDSLRACKVVVNRV